MSGKRKSVLILTGGALLLLSLIFLPGPNGLVRVLLKLYRIKQHQAAILQLKNEADTLEQKIKLWQDPRYATKMAHTVFSSDTTPHSDTIK